MSNPSFKLLGHSVDPKTNHTIYEHGVFNGDVRTGSALVAVSPEKKFAGLKVKGIKTGDLKPLEAHLREQHPDVMKAKAPADQRSRREAASLKNMKGAEGGSSGPAPISPAEEKTASHQVAICDTPGCGGRLKFQEVRNKYGFTQTMESCPNCGKTQPVRRRVATAEDAGRATADDLHEARWKAESGIAKAVQTVMHTAPIASPDKDPAPELDHDRVRIKTAIRALLGKKETPGNPNGKVDKKRLIKSITSPSRYEELVSDMQSLSSHLADRVEWAKPDPVTAKKGVMHVQHNAAAHLVLHARQHLDHARRHMLQAEPSMVDRVRSRLHLTPLSEKHLQTAGTLLRGAKAMTIFGDQEMQEKGHYTHPTDLSREDVPTLTMKDHNVIMRTLTAHKKEVPGAAWFLHKEVMRGRQQPGTNAGAPAPTATAQKAPRARKTAPGAEA